MKSKAESLVTATEGSTARTESPASDPMPLSERIGLLKWDAERAWLRFRYFFEHVADCDTCGFPTLTAKMVKGRYRLECRDCAQMGVMLRALHQRHPEAFAPMSPGVLWGPEGFYPDLSFPPDPDAGYVRPHAEIHDDLLKANLEIYELKRVLARLHESNGNQATVFQDDVCDLLLALGLSDRARSVSPHRVLQEEVLPAIRSMRGWSVSAPHSKLGDSAK